MVAVSAVACSADSPDSPEAAGSSGGDATEARTVTVGANPISDLAPLWVGDQAGVFEDHGITLDIQTGGGGAALLPSVVSGQYQFAFANPTTLFVAEQQGLDLRVVSNLASSTGEPGSDGSAVLVRDDSPIQSPADLAGATVAINTFNSIGTTVIRESVRQAGADPDAIEFVEIGFGDMMAALEAGNVDAAWEVEPFISSSVANGYRAVAWPYVDVDPELPIALAFTSAQQAEEDPQLIEDFAAALAESIEYSNENPDEVRSVIPTFTALTAEQVENVFYPRWTTDINRDAVSELGQLMVQDGVLPAEPDLDSLLP
ncbi:ABC transporter substrate-binding protein [Geodermatophilus sp. CPCC 206100]|uniref:ABC transporter substrate-binding protein n=1 Tax=Geodermatophilus sp. CPCC 206100 TaxID=3020054 RepID=UPI003AFFB63D